MTPTWRADDDALLLLDEVGGPFEAAGVRSAFAEALPRTHDASVGARLADGTRAALAVLARRRTAQALPRAYAAIRATRALTDEEKSSFLAHARRRANVLVLVTRAVPNLDGDLPGARPTSTTHLVHLDRGEPAAAYSRAARRSLRRADTAGVTVGISDDAADFLGLYNDAATRYVTTYPETLLHDLAATGRARWYTARIGAAAISSMLALRGTDHWCYWLGAQNDAGRAHHAGYACAHALLEDAMRCGVRAVNLGASASRGRTLEGVATFKDRLGAVVVPVVESVTGVPGAATLLHARRRFHV